MGLPGKFVLLLVSLSICSAAADATGPRATTGSAQRGVYASLRAKWESTSVALEAAEFLADEDMSLFWTYVDALSAGGGFNSSGTCWSRILRSASQGLNQEQAKMLKAFVAIRHYSAKLEMYRSIATVPEDACCWVQLGSFTAYNTAQLGDIALKAAKAGEQETLFAFDHIYPFNSSSTDAAPGAVLYGAPGTACFRVMHTAMVKLAQQQMLKYVFRPILVHGCTMEGIDCLHLGTGEQLPLPGYGAELAIKNMEYKAMDDASLKSKGQDDGSASSERTSGDVAGFIIDRLISRKPEARESLESFRDHLLIRQSSSQDEPLKVWDLKDLGLQAVQRVSSSSDPLRLLMEVSQNFPALATSLSRIQVDPALRREVQRIQESLPSGTNFLLLNGIMVDVDQIELYKFMEHVRHDSRLAKHLELAGVSPSLISKLLALRPTMTREEAAEIRIDIGSKPSVTFLNNLEKDRMYSGWHSSLQVLLMPSFGGQMQPIGRNVFTAIFVMDPGHEQSYKIVSQILGLWQQGVPIRFGVLLLPESMLARASGETDSLQNMPLVAWEDADVSERIARAFHMLHKSFGPGAAYTFLLALGNENEEEPYGYEDSDEYEGTDDSTTSSHTWEDVAKEFASAWSKAGSRASTKKARAAAKVTPEQALGQLAEGAGQAAGIAELVANEAGDAIARGLIPVQGEGALLWFNGLLHFENPLGALFQALQKEMQHVQRDIYQGKLSDGSNVATAILRNAGALPRYNAMIFGKKSRAPALGGNETAHPADGAIREASLTAEPVLADIKYFAGDGKLDTVKKVTHWVIADIGSPKGQALVHSALKYVASSRSAQARAALIHCGSEGETVPNAARLLPAALDMASEEDHPFVTAFLTDLFGPDGLQARQMMAQPADDMMAFQSAVTMAEQAGLDPEKLMEAIVSGPGSAAAASHYTQTVCQTFQAKFGINVTRPGVVTNGRIVTSGPEAPSSGFTEDDFHLMGVYAEKAQHAGMVKTALGQQKGQDASITSDQVMLASNLILRLGIRDDMHMDETSVHLASVVSGLRRKKGALITWEPVEPDAPTPVLEITAVVDPLTAGAQKLVALLVFLRDTVAPRIRVWLNPALNLSELPLKSFFRFALPDMSTGSHMTALQANLWDETEDMPGAPSAVFTNLPQKKILTLNLHPPEAWLVEPVRAVHDTDNLLLADLPDGDSMATADFELEAMIISGSCIDIGASSRKQMTPRGVQLHLGTANQSRVTDTLVMSNLGYFQLKGSGPGLWSIRLAPGASSMLYTVVSSTDVSEAGSRQTHTDPNVASVVMSGMNGKHLTLLLKKKPGHAADDVLMYKPPEAEGGLEEQGRETGEQGSLPGLWSSVKSMFSPAAVRQAEPQATINVFTVASGHMYERLQKIMILSVLRHASAPVKFWFIKNYMSPQMKAFLPHFAASYGFEYELVTYKWPQWLHKQTEKQRIIWAYKILFLDVLFPLDLDKVIFVDADQIIREDLRKLVDMDLHGAPYAYTPFCDNNKDMDGYRFWNSGFWKSHLQGRPYHISALYVVDLKRFRETAAGDQLRVIYDQLSKDPNSLANLDQDLPNYAQHQVPIFSLPQEWLWCESWCGNATKPMAKTIDLCNNPMTKEPKLTGARRIVSEWSGYDAEVTSFTARVESILEGDEEAEDAPALAGTADSPRSTSRDGDDNQGAEKTEL